MNNPMITRSPYHIANPSGRGTNAILFDDRPVTRILDISNITPLVVEIDESVLSGAKSSVEEKQQELTELLRRKQEVEEEIALAEAEHRTVAVSHELGEADAKLVSESAKKLERLNDVLAKLSDDNKTLLSAIAVKEGAIGELEERRKSAIRKERLNVMQRGSETCKTTLAALMQKAKECNGLAEQFRREFAALQKSQLVRGVGGDAKILDYELLTELFFHEFEAQLYPHSDTPHITKHEDTRR